MRSGGRWRRRRRASDDVMGWLKLNDEGVYYLSWACIIWIYQNNGQSCNQIPRSRSMGLPSMRFRSLANNPMAS